MKLKETLIETKVIEDLDMEYPYYDGDIQTIKHDSCEYILLIAKWWKYTVDT